MPEAIRAVLLGAPGSGKGTQAERLSSVLSVPAISTGDLLRQAVADRTPLGARVEEVMSSGQLVDDDLMAAVVRERLGRPDAEGGFLLDGYPRTPQQAETLDGILKEREQQLAAVIFLDVPEETLVRRAVARRRADDREAVVRERLRLYRQITEPLVGHYEAKGLVSRIRGDEPIPRVTRSILAALGRDD
jgi:adenylate kinase